MEGNEDAIKFFTTWTSSYILSEFFSPPHDILKHGLTLKGSHPYPSNVDP